MLDSAKAAHFLGWHPVWDIEDTMKHTVNWYHNLAEDAAHMTQHDIQQYMRDAAQKNAVWAVK